MEAHQESADIRTARSWLIAQRLPHHDPDALVLVAARLAARRKGQWFDLLLFLTFSVAYLLWLVTTDAESEFSSSAKTAIPIAVAMAISLLRRSVVWWRRDRDTAARLRERVAPLDRPTWSELLGRPTVVLLAGLFAAALSSAATTSVGDQDRPWQVFLVLLGGSYCVARLELARRRSVLAQDVVTLAADRRLRIGEAVEGVVFGSGIIAVVPSPAGSGTIGAALLWCGYLLVSGSAWWHTRQVRSDLLVAAPGGVR